MPISIGRDDAEKQQAIAAYRAAHAIQRVVVITPDRFPLVVPDADQVRYADVTMYVTFYRLLQEIDRHTLVVLNECLQTQNRHDLTYNCVRNFLNQTEHQLVFQYLPQIDAADDFMTLFDWDTRSRWKRRPFDADLVAREARVDVRDRVPTVTGVAVPTTDATRQRYATERERLFQAIGSRDPHVIPRQLALVGGADKVAWVDAQRLPLFGDDRRYVARNGRLRRGYLTTYDEVQPGTPYGIVDLPHRFLDFVHFLTTTRPATCEVLVADLPVDRWYLRRYQDWSERTHATCASLSAG